MSTASSSTRFRELGEARLKFSREAKTPEDWEAWAEPADWPFAWGECWKFCVEYHVDDYAAEVGFLIDVVGLGTNAFSDEFAMFTGPEHEFTFMVFPPAEGKESTPAGTIRLGFMVGDVEASTKTLEERGVTFQTPPTPTAEGSPMLKATFHTPHGVAVDLWGMKA